MQILDLMFELLCFILYDAPLSDKTKERLNEKTVRKIYDIAYRHNLTHLVAYAIKKAGLMEDMGEFKRVLERAIIIAFERYVKSNYEFDRLHNEFEKNAIMHLPLKGLVLRQYYPEPWMRTSSDIDVLVRQEDLDYASNLLVEKLNYKKCSLSEHDISFMTPSGVHLELHYDFHECDMNKSEIFNDMVVCDGGNYKYKISNEMFMFYHIAHMAKHFKIGGCGLRPFLDLFILTKNVKYDEKKLQLLLKKSSLGNFANVVFELCQVWFAGAQSNEEINLISEFIIDAKITKNMIAIRNINNNDKKTYLFSRIFIGYQGMKYAYPILIKHKWLLPLCQLHRWFKLVFKGKLRRLNQEIKINNDIDYKKIKEIKRIFTIVDLPYVNKKEK